MTAELGQTRDPAALIPGDLGALHHTAAAWRARADGVEGVGSKLRDMRSVPEWTGEAADAYETRVTTVASGWTAMADALRRGRSALEEVAAAIDAARGRAGDAIDLWDEADASDAAALLTPSVSSPGFSDVGRRSFSGSGRRAEARAILGDARSSVEQAAQRAAATLRAAIALPDLGADEWAALLTGCANSAQVLDALAGADGRSLALLLAARPALAAILAQAEPAAVAPWWAALDDEQKDALIHSAPAVIGNLGGVAYSARDEANRIWLDTQLDEARAALAEAEKPMSVWEAMGGEGVALAHAERIAEARTRLNALETVEESLEAPDGAMPRHLVSLTSDVPPLAAISIGDLDEADVVTYAVPGMGTTTEGMNSWTRAAQNIADQQHRVDSGRTHAVVAWVGYETPPVPGPGGGFDVMYNDLADEGGAKLAHALTAFDVVRPDAQINVVAHSYGTTTASIALTHEGVNVDTFVTLGSAGLPAQVNHASDIHATAVFAGQAQDVWAVDPADGDQWAWTGRLSSDHPVNPIEPAFGAHAFGVTGGNGLQPVADHGVEASGGTGYLDPRTESLRNVALATTGNGDQLSPYVEPGPTPFQQAMIDGMKYGPVY